MIETDLSIYNGERGLVEKESSISPEFLNTTNRVVVFGTRRDGAFVLAEEFQEYLKKRNIPEPTVDVCRNVKYIEDAFFNKNYVIHENEELPAHLQELTNTRSLAKFVTNVLGFKKGKDSKGRPETPQISENTQLPTLPKGVIVLPEMRQYSEESNFGADLGMTVESPHETIKQLCQKYKVPIVILRKIDDEDITNMQISNEIKAFLEPEKP